jgi:HEAT repeat protein
MAERAHIFLSYCSAEVDFALRLGADLKNAGVNLWMDRFDIHPGDDWRRGIQHALTRSAALIPVLSPAYLASTYCRHELAHINRLGRLTIPILLHPLSSSEWPPEIAHEYIDFSLSQDELFYHNQLGKLIDILQEQVEPTLGAPEPEIQYLNRLIADLENNKGVISLYETSPAYEAILPNGDLRPQPILGQSWHLHGRYLLTGETVGLENEVVRSIRESVALDSIYDAVDKCPRFLLISPPGFGKTLTIQSLALDAARQYQMSPLTAPLPLLIKLHQWDDDVHPTSLIRQHWPLASDPIELLAKGKISLYLDGLSEMPAENADAKVEMLREWLNSDSAPQHMVITCRAEDYDRGVHLDLPVVQAVDLDGTHIQRFVEYYLEEDEAKYFLYSILGPEGKDSRSATLLYSMARNPFLLSALVMMYRISMEREVVYSTGSLIQGLVTGLWERRYKPGILEEISYEQIESALIHLAFAMVENDIPIYVGHDKAVEYTGNQLLLSAALDADLLESDSGEIRFPHELFRQYFAAMGLQADGLPTKLTRPQFDPTFQRIPRKWDSIMTMLVGIVPNPDAVILNIAEVDPYLALQCIFCGVHLEERTYRAVIQRQLDLMSSEKDYRVAMAQILIGADDYKATLILLEALRDGSWTVRQAAAEALSRIDIQPLPAVIEALDKLEDANREETLQAMCALGVDALPTLFVLLRAPNWHTRQGAAWALGELREKGAVPFLIEALEDTDHAVIAEAALALGLLQDPAAVPNLVSALAHVHWRVSKAAARALAFIGQDAIPALIEVLKNRTNPVGQRVRAIEALAYSKRPEVGSVLVKLTQSRNIDERYSAVKALKYYPSEAATRRLIECLTDEGKPRWSTQRICDLAATILEMAGTDENLAVVEKWRQRQLRSAKTIMKEPSGKTVKERLRRVMQPSSGTEAPVAPLRDVHNTDWVVRRDAVLALASESAVVAVPKLVTALADEDSQVRITAIKTLTRFRDDARVLPVLVQALYDDEYLVGDAAKDALKTVGKPPLPGLMSALRSTNLNVRAAAIDIAGAIGEQDAIPDLIESLTDIRTLWLSDERMCDIAATALEAIGTPTALEAADQWRSAQSSPVRQPIPALENTEQERDILGELLEGLHSKEWGVRQEAAKALREYAQFSRGVPDSLFVQPLTDALSDPDWVVRWAASEALAWIRDPAPVPALAVLVKDSNWMVRSAAIRALMEIGDPTASDSVMQGLLDENAMVREAAAEALGKIGDARAIPALSGVLRDNEQLVRLAAIDALGNLNEPGAVEVLQHMVRYPDKAVRWYVAEALRKIGHPSGVPALVKLLNDSSHPSWEERRVCDVAASALETINTPEAQAALDAWQQNLAIH